MKTILITGATSFLGSKLIHELEKDKKLKIIKTSLHGNAKQGIEKLDLLQPSKVKRFIANKKPEIIFHFAALVNLTRDYDTARKCIDANITATLNLLEACSGSSLKRFIFSSTEEIYGINILPYKEVILPNPPSMYSISKIAGEQLCEYYSKIIGFRLIILRIGTLYGPGSQPDRFLTSIFKSVVVGKPILLNSGKLKRDYIYISDAVSALLKSMKKAFRKNEIINIGGSTSISLRKFIEMAVKNSKSTSKIMFNAFPDRIGEAPVQKMSILKAKELLNWEPKIDLAVGIKKSIAFFSQNGYH
ncbi:hypothetical protein A3D80_04365 [Candidatus Roizmanbacteria bacterium RIFCSPHIGHO2_02_FULL_40_13b]|uniref:NAD-dependent epimerase/dehydratase domain-containing protein n=1 Tax=Candidatus Roizmanbacteria bacterium RIFCSPHIGHO2_01_FULL_39_24 TaxID=1802032 RepID=A0A1F7GN70_9BACT|nr:MAG: hypothetical protein A2799_00135 [Candidatus Roizmanbacteria bacterium RIFCSPHIGHO2_01_FULL_39_24]OGK27745.1 MAG: hypothetical protein A3D80_04365 [Candidatus Roizmanbacteria bacterium RIFCSPHIGHO2_02_FULL_40_13b]OGK49509.1 MAG: hypothetical protein A3A56_02055 [Candidatus Roizmanbacteria bacterium RIFCSPLOWO2_01_FULL_40_32]